MAAANQRLGEYILIDRIGSGAFGEVWRARHHAWADQIVAIKIPTDSRYASYLQKEGAAIGRLAHPTIVKAIAFDPYHDPAYLVMEYVDGPNLRQLIQDDRISIADAVAIMKQVLDALHYAHARGIIHRDVKPENILIDRCLAAIGFSKPGSVRLGDFGLGSTDVQNPNSIVFSADRQASTRIVGSAAYMSPEQRDGGKIDARSDLYSCGIVLFEMLTGQRPAGAESPSEVNPNVPRSIDEVFRLAYARLDHRFASAKDFFNALVPPATFNMPPTLVPQTPPMLTFAPPALGSMPPPLPPAPRATPPDPKQISGFASSLGNMLTSAARDMALRESRQENWSSRSRRSRQPRPRRESATAPLSELSRFVIAMIVLLIVGPVALMVMLSIFVHEAQTTIAPPVWPTPNAVPPRPPAAPPDEQARTPQDVAGPARWPIAGARNSNGLPPPVQQPAAQMPKPPSPPVPAAAQAAPPAKETTAVASLVPTGRMLAIPSTPDELVAAKAAAAAAQAKYDAILADDPGYQQAKSTADRAESVVKSLRDSETAGSASLAAASQKWINAKSALAEEAARVATAQNQLRITILAETAKANDSEENGRIALYSLDQLLTLDPKNPEALALRAKIRSYYFVTNSVGMTLMVIKPGTFHMGSAADEQGRFDNELQHEVRLTKGYMMATTLVTVSQFAIFESNAPYKTAPETQGYGAGASWHNPGFDQGDDYPAVEVSWYDAVAFCDWLSKKEGQHYRLPTEAEWEYAARAGSQTAYWWGDSPIDGHGCANCLDLAAKGKVAGADSFNWSDGYIYTSPVGRFKSNAWGLYDMAGNVWEWCADWLGDYPVGNVADPRGPNSGQNRVLRGASWGNGPGSCRVARRHGIPPDVRQNNVGFRIVLESE